MASLAFIGCSSDDEEKPDKYIQEGGAYYYNYNIEGWENASTTYYYRWYNVSKEYSEPFFHSITTRDGEIVVGNIATHTYNLETSLSKAMRNLQSLNIPLPYSEEEIFESFSELRIYGENSSIIFFIYR